tara:strand:- start:958 stop:1182 length:225 start_codon:yes stop_codon:yes gene_type:complete
MDLPKFLIADSSVMEDNIFIAHTEYPRFFLNVANEEVHWMEHFEKEDMEELESQTVQLIEKALDFYENEMKNLD